MLAGRLRAVMMALVALAGAIGLPYLLYGLLYAVVRPDGSPAAKDYAYEPSVSIILPTYNEERIVETKLKGITELEYPMEKVEVIVVDSSDDATPELIESFFNDRKIPELTLIRKTKRHGLAIALNEAYAAASNEVVVKTDCDSELAADALREAVANLADTDIGAVTGRNAEVLGGSQVERGYRDIQAYVQTLESHLDSTLIFHGPFSAFERESIVMIDEDSIADDTELALKIRKNDKRVIFDPAICYREAAHSEFRKRRRQKDRRAMGLLRLLWRQRSLLGRCGAYGKVVLPFNWWFMFVSPVLVVGTMFVATAAALGFGGVAGLFIPASVAVFIALGARDRLGSLQPIYALFDTQVSLFRAALKLLCGNGTPVWDQDSELREAYE